MEALDGNAIGGKLFEYFGAEMTAASGTCSHCGATNEIAKLRVYNRAPGAVVRCPACGDVVMVLVNIHDTLRVDLSSFPLLGTPGGEAKRA
jgi:DNA-directed RNA polymerase subunit RPC12/RpoP